MSQTITKKKTVAGVGRGATVKERRAAVALRGAGVLRELSQRVAPDDLSVGLEALERAFEPKSAEETVVAKSVLVSRLTDGRVINAKARAELEFSNLQRAFERRRHLLEGALSAAQVGALLGSKTRQTPHDRREAGTLLAIQDNGTWKFPLWQFDADGPDGVVAGLPETLRTLRASGFVLPLHQAAFLLRENPAFGGQSALQQLRAGALSDVLNVARGVGVS